MYSRAQKYFDNSIMIEFCDLVNEHNVPRVTCLCRYSLVIEFALSRLNLLFLTRETYMWLNRSVEIECISWNSTGIHIWNGSFSPCVMKAEMNSSSCCGFS